MPTNRNSQNWIVVGGSLAQRLGCGGHAWVFLQYLLGLRRLGWSVLFLDWLDAPMCVDDRGESCGFAQSVNVRYLADVMASYGLEDSFSVSLRGSRETVGLPRREVIERCRRSALLINVMGYLDDDELLGMARCRVFLDVDPGFGQMWLALGLHDVFSGHDRYVSIAENIGDPGCSIPTGSIDWLTTRPPVVLEHWPVRCSAVNGVFTTVASWRGPFAPIEYEGRIYGLRVHEFRLFAALPQRTGASFQLALDINPAETQDLALLNSHGWALTDPAVAATPESYAEFIGASGAEFMVAKNMYVQSRSGWVSDRSVCYLASGKPVLAQDTGLGDRYPTGEGLITFTTLDEAVAGVEAITTDYERHCRAARQVAEEHFDSDVVLTRLLGALGVG